MNNKTVKSLIRLSLIPLCIGIASIIISIFAFTPLFAISAIILGVLAIIISIKTEKLSPSAAATAGMICGIIGLCIGFAHLFNGNCIFQDLPITDDNIDSDYETYDVPFDDEYYDL